MDADTPRESLCLSCGICCDGTLFGRVPLDAADALIPLRAGGIDVQSSDTGHHFDLPCAAYRQACCQVYADRPAICQAYRCRLLRKYESGAVSWADAQRRISRVQMLKGMLKTELARITAADLSVVAVMRIVPTEEELGADVNLRRYWAPVLLRLSALLDCVQTHFQPPSREVKTGTTEPAPE